jgi:hypothetical protein
MTTPFTQKNKSILHMHLQLQAKVSAYSHAETPKELIDNSKMDRPEDKRKQEDKNHPVLPPTKNEDLINLHLWEEETTPIYGIPNYARYSRTSTKISRLSKLLTYHEILSCKS